MLIHSNPLVPVDLPAAWTVSTSTWTSAPTSRFVQSSRVKSVERNASSSTYVAAPNSKRTICTMPPAFAALAKIGTIALVVIGRLSNMKSKRMSRERLSQSIFTIAGECYRRSLWIMTLENRATTNFQLPTPNNLISNTFCNPSDKLARIQTRHILSTSVNRFASSNPRPQRPPGLWEMCSEQRQI